MFRFRSRKNAQRKYVDLIKEAAAKWPNWDPPKQILPGDFGVINKETGELAIEGNIYTHVDTMSIANRYHVIPAPEVDQFEIHSYEVRGIDINAAVGANAAAAAVPGLVFRWQWQFNARRGAILLMHRPQLMRVPDQFFNPETLALPVLKGKMVVYQTWNCHGYYMYLSSRTSERVAVSLQTNVVNPAAPAVAVNPDINLGWVAEGCTGVRQHAYRQDAIYTPLFCLKEIRRPLLRRDESGLGRDGWHEADVPWDDIDDEGVTEPEVVYDNGPDDDDDE